MKNITLNGEIYEVFEKEYCNNIYEEKCFIYKNKKIWLSYNELGRYISIFSINNDFSLLEKAEDILNSVMFNNEYIKYSIKSIEINEINANETCSLNKTLEYDEFINNLVYSKKAYELINKNSKATVFYKDIELETIVFFQAYFSAKELLDNFKIEGKTIKEIWNQLY